MDIPFTILKSAGGSKTAALLALLAGLVILSAMTSKQRASPPKPRP